METSAAKRRKLDHHGSTAQNPRRNGAVASAFTEAAEDLLSNVKLDYGQAFEGADDFLRGFKEVIESIEPHEATPIGEASSNFEKTSNVSIPYPTPRPEKTSPYKVSFTKPAQVNVVGSYQLRTMVRSQTRHSIDMIVVMPRAIFQDKDYLNLRYFYKRAYYLACVASSIRDAFEDSIHFTFEELHGNNLLPVLVARPKQVSKEKQAEGNSRSDRGVEYAIRVIPCAPEGLLPASKLGATSNAVRLANHDTTETLPPTPFYNASLKAEGHFSSYLRLLNTASKSCAAFKDACLLGRVWLQQRGFAGGISTGGFGHFEWAVLVALLLQGGGRKGEAVLSNSLGSTQIFKAIIQFLAGVNLQRKPLVFGAQPRDLDAMVELGPVVYDTVRELNILWKMTPWSGRLLQQHAKWSHAGLRDNSLNQFDSLFILKVDQPMHTFDVTSTVEVPLRWKGLEGPDKAGQNLDFSKKLYNVLEPALGDRCQLINIAIPQSVQWQLSATPKHRQGTLSVGIILNAINAGRRLDQGPSVEDKAEAAKFREFWGDKAELRRFQDGSILECVEWDNEIDASIPEQIIRYITRLSSGLGKEAVSFRGGEMERLAHIAASDMLGFSAARRALEVLERDIRDLEDLPLHVRQIAATDPGLRFSAIQSLSTAAPTEPLSVIIAFEQSGKWADTLAAIQRLKIAFLLKIGSSLEAAKDEVKTHLGLDNAYRDIQNLAYLDIVYESGFAFRLRVQSDAEEAELEKVVRDKTKERHRQVEAAELLATCKRLYTNLPLHNQAIATYCTRLPPLSASIRLVKYWFSSHKLTSHFAEELIELFVLQAFLKPCPWQTPTSPQTGFLRTLQLLSRWEWHEEPLVVDTSESISASDRAAILALYNESRRQDPKLNRIVMFVATSYDQTGTAYTNKGPSKVVANQMTKLARSACDLVKSKGLDLDFRSLFQSSTRHYDAVIRLNPKAVRNALRDDGTRHSQFKNLNKRSGNAGLPHAEHPVQSFVRVLNTAYSSALVLFHGGQDSHVLACIWNQDVARQSRTSKTNMPCAFNPTEGEDALELDKTSILAEIARIGGDLIEKIETKHVNE